MKSSRTHFEGLSFGFKYQKFDSGETEGVYLGMLYSL